MTLLDSILVEEQFSLNRSPKPNETCSLRANFNFEFFPQKNEMQEVKLNYLLDILSAKDKSPIGNVVLKNIYMLNVSDLEVQDENAKREQIMTFLRDSIKTSLVNDLNNIFIRGRLPQVYISTIFPSNATQN